MWNEQTKIKKKTFMDQNKKLRKFCFIHRLSVKAEEITKN